MSLNSKKTIGTISNQARDILVGVNSIGNKYSSLVIEWSRRRQLKSKRIHISYNFFQKFQIEIRFSRWEFHKTMIMSSKCSKLSGINVNQKRLFIFFCNKIRNVFSIFVLIKLMHTMFIVANVLIDVIRLLDQTVTAQVYHNILFEGTWF